MGGIPVNERERSCEWSRQKYLKWSGEWSRQKYLKWSGEWSRQKYLKWSGEWSYETLLHFVHSRDRLSQYLNTI